MPNNKNTNIDNDKKAIQQRIASNNAQSTQLLYGVSQDFLTKNSEVIEKLKNTIKRISYKNNTITGENPIEFLTKVSYNEKNNNSNKLKNIAKKEKINLNNFVNGITLGQINEIYALETPRISRYQDYLAIVEYIPQLSQAINVWKDNIISPDDFTKDIFGIIYDDDKDTEIKNKVEKNILDYIYPKYDIESRVDKWIKDTLILGDQFVAILKLEDEFNKIFQENVENKESYNIIDESTTLNENRILINEAEQYELLKLHREQVNSNLNEEERKADERNFVNTIKNELATILNDNISFSTKPLSILKEEEIPLVQYFRNEIDNKKYISNDSGITGTVLSNNKLGSDSTQNNNRNDNFINGSYIKNLEPERVVKIKIGETVYGYFYIEVRNKNDLDQKPHNVYSALTLRQTIDLATTDTSFIDDPKVRLITDLFAKNIGEKIDKKFIAKNKEFKNIIYELVKKDYIYNNNIQITFLEPEIVKHLMVEEGDDGYGVSILNKILFTAKIYLSMLVCTLLTKLSRSQDHRTFYIETGLSEDVEGIVNSFIRDVETKDVKLSDTQSIDSIFTTVGACSNYYIPRVNGENAVDIDVTSGLNVEMDNDFMDYLRKAMISGTGVPASMLNYSDELEFSRSVSMVNGMFLRSIIVKQKKLTEPFSSMYRSLYENDFGTSTIALVDQKEINLRRKKKDAILSNRENEISDLDKEEIKNNKEKNKNNEEVNINLIKVQFPSPSSLNATNLAEQISTAQSIVQAITDTMFNQNSTIDEAHKFTFVKELNKKYIPNVDWDSIYELYESTKLTSIEDKIKSSASNIDANS